MKFWQRYWYYIGGVAFVILTFAMGLGAAPPLTTCRFCSSSAGWACWCISRRVCLAGRFSAHLEHDRLQRDRASGSLYLEPAPVLRQQRRPVLSMLYRSDLLPAAHLACRGSDIPGLWQIPAHGIVLNMRLKSKYNPGLLCSQMTYLLSCCNIRLFLVQIVSPL